MKKDEEIQIIDKLSKESDSELLTFKLDTENGDPGPVIPNRHTFYEIILLTKGDKTLHHIDFNAYSMNDNSIFFIAPGQIHSWEEKSRLKGRVLRFTEVCFINPQILSKLSIFYHETSPTIDLDNEQLNTLLEKINSIEKEIESKDVFHLDYIYSSLLLLLIDLEREFKKHNSQEDLVESLIITKLIEYHKKESWKIQNVESVADALDISEDRLNREVKKYTGLSIGSFLRSKTILEAKRLLVFLDEPASSIGEKLGFVDAAYFSRFFKRETGMNPTQFREKYK